MKTKKLAHGIYLILLIFVCILVPQSNAATLEKISPPENKVIRLQPEPFTKIHSSGVIHITYQIGPTYSFVMEGEQKLVENISVESKNGTLLLKKIHSSSNNEQAVEIRITAPCLEEYYHQGVGSFELIGKQEKTDFTIRIEGISNINLKEATVRNLTLHCSGIGNLSWDRLKCTEFNYQKNGVSNLNGKQLDCQRIILSHSGVGDTHIDKINCQYLDLDKSGVGNVTLKNIHCDELTVKNSGPRKIKLTGKTNRAIHKGKGVDISRLKIKNK